MTAGISLLATTGNVSIDSDTPNLCFISATNITSSNYRSGYYGNIYLASVTYSGVNPVVAVHSPNGLAGVAWIDNNGGGSYTAHVFTGFSALNVTIYVFDQTPATPSGNSGLQIFNSAGTLIFDSGRKYMNIKQMIFGANVTSLPASKYAVGPSCVAMYGSSDALGAKISMWGYQSTATGANVNTIVYDLGPGGYAYLGTSPAGLIIDVSNLP